jgi:NADH dehydrogenase
LLVPARRLPYSALVIAVGSLANDFGTPGVKEHCLTIDSRVQADAFNREVRIRMLQCMTQDTELSIAIVGGGATGVELAAELVQLTEDAVAYGAQGLAARVRITLIESGPRLLAASALRGKAIPPFRYRDFGSLVSLGGYDAFGSLGKFGFFGGGFIRGRVAQFGHAMLYRSHQARLHGFWRGGLIWLVDRINARLRPSIRLD